MVSLAHAALGLLPPCRGLANGGGLEVARGIMAVGGVSSLAVRGNDGRGLKELPPEARSRSSRREVVGQPRLKVTAVQMVEGGRSQMGLEIPVTCYQILGLTEQAEKDEIAKAALDLTKSEIENGYTRNVVVLRKDLLKDVRDKLLFEPEYAGNFKEKVPPKSSICIPWAWLPCALCILQEVGEEKLVLEIGRAALQLADAKPYTHDLLLSMALAECSIAKAGFEKNKISEGFEALARAQYLLRSNISLEKMPLLEQIEESLEELAPACTLDLLGMPLTPENAERRRGALAALRELLRQGLHVESSCRVQDWPCYLSQMLNKLMASEIVDLLSWDTLAITRKNKKSLESQNQRVVIDFSCFYVAMIAHIAVGFSTRQTDMISKAKTICECLIASEGVDMKFEEAFCSFLLGQGTGNEAVEKLRQLEANGSPTSRGMELTAKKEDKEKGTMHGTLEKWLKDAVLCIFPDTRDCSPSLADFFGGPRRTLNCGRQKMGTMKTVSSNSYRSPTFGRSANNGTSGEQASHINFTGHLGEAVKQLSHANLQGQLTLGKSADSTSSPSLQLKRNLGLDHAESWPVIRNLVGRMAYTTLLGCFLFGTYRLLSVQFSHIIIPHKCHTAPSKMSMEAHSWTSSHPLGSKGTSAFIDRNILGHLGKLLTMFGGPCDHSRDVGTLHNSWPSDGVSNFPAVPGNLVHKRQMALEEAEALVKQWQDIKAEALGPNHHTEMLSEILAESMLSKWQDLANSAKAKSCFWRFVLLQLSILHAEILSDGVSSELAEIEALLEEAAELVDESQLKKPSYHSTYKIRYILKKQDDGSWRICGGYMI